MSTRDSVGKAPERLDDPLGGDQSAPALEVQPIWSQHVAVGSLSTHALRTRPVSDGKEVARLHARTNDVVETIGGSVIVDGLGWRKKVRDVRDDRSRTGGTPDRRQRGQLPNESLGEARITGTDEGVVDFAFAGSGPPVDEEHVRRPELLDVTPEPIGKRRTVSGIFDESERRMDSATIRQHAASDLTSLHDDDIFCERGERLAEKVRAGVTDDEETLEGRRREGARRGGRRRRAGSRC